MSDVRSLAGLVFAAIAIAASAQADTTQPQPNPPRSLSPVPNRAPLLPDAFYSLPLGAVKPVGWLKNELKIQAAGLSGHLDEFWPDVGSNSAWLGGTGEAWERGPYYLDGLVPLAYELDDPVLIEKVRKWVNFTLDHQRPDGAIGPEKNTDWWPDMIMLKALTQYQEATGDARVVPALEKFFAYQAATLAANPLQKWAQYRWGDELLSIIWLYNRDGDSKLLDLARQIAGQGFDWKALYANFPFTGKVAKKDADLRSHGVNNAMAIKTGAVWSVISGNPADRDASRQMLDTLNRYHGLPNGTFAADEHLAGRDPDQGTELCAIVEEMFSIETLTRIYGDSHIAGRLERLAYNALPAVFSKDMWAHQYDEQPNQVLVSKAPRDWTTNGDDSNLFGLEPNYGCCTANMHQGWPKFTASTWMATADKGLVAVVLAPTEVNTVVNDVPVRIVEETEYPFAENVTIRVEPARPVAFPITLPVSPYTSETVIRVNGAAQRNLASGQFYRIAREWTAGDVIQIKMPFPVMVGTGYRSSVYVTLGPLLFSLDIGERWKKLERKGETADWEVDPTTPWNYGLIIHPADPQSAFTINRGQMGNQPFSPEGTPVSLTAKGVRIRSWKLVDNSAGPLPQSPVKESGGAETLKLIPYGAAKLRITEFPEIIR